MSGDPGVATRLACAPDAGDPPGESRLGIGRAARGRRLRRRVTCRSRAGRRPGGPGNQRVSLLQKTEEALAELHVTPHGVASPEGECLLRALGGLDEHVAVGDSRDPPDLVSEHEDFTDPALPHELLVELADAGAVLGTAKLVVPAVGYGSPRVVEQARHPGAGGRDAGDAIDRDPRLELPHACGAVLPGEEVDDRIELLAGELGVGVDAPDEIEELIEIVRLHGDHREKYLGEHVEGLSHRGNGLDIPLHGGAGGDDGIKAIAAEEGIHARAARGADLMPRATGHLQAGGNREGRLREDHLVYGADVDAELERRGGDDGLELPASHLLLHEPAHLAGKRSVVRIGDSPPGVFIEQQGYPLRIAAVRREEQARSVPLDDARKLTHHGDPGRLRLLAGPRVDGLHGDIEDLGVGCLDDPHRPRAAHELGHDLERSNGRRQCNSLKLAAEPGEPLHRCHQVHAPLASGYRMHLVEDHHAHVPENAPSPAGAQKQVEALGGGGENVWGLLQHPPALALRRVSASRRRANIRGVREYFPQALEGLCQVLPDVAVERLQRRDVENRQASGRPRTAEQAVERIEKGGEGFAAAGRRGNEDVLACGDGCAACILDLGGCAEALLEPARGLRLKPGPLTHSTCRSTDRPFPG